MLLLKNAGIVEKDNLLMMKDILIDGKTIIRIDENIEENAETIDLHGQLVLPGMIDAHAHLREPGYEHKETIKTGTLAAARGGFTTIMPMPNVIPYPDNVETMTSYLQKLKEDAVVNVIPYACITKGESGKEVVDMKALNTLGVHIFSDDGVGVQNDEMMLSAMKCALATDSMIVAHTEDNNYKYPGACLHDGKKCKELGLVGIPSMCEYKQIERDLKLVEETGCAYHICHISAKESVELLRNAKKKGLNVTGEVTTHHLVLNEEDVVDSNWKMNPPLRTKEDQKILFEALLDGTIDFIANDHAPHSEEEKAKGFEKAPFGIVAFETSLPMLFTKFVKTGKMTLEQFINFTSLNPAKRFHLNKGKIEVGYDADLIVVNDSDEFVIDKNEFVSKGKNTPFHNEKCFGKVVMTIVNGNICFR